MAHIIITEENLQHLVDRARGRFNRDETIARKEIQRIKSLLEEQAPEDWRFTRNPVAKFLICDEETDFRLLGRTFRDVGRELIDKLKNPEIKEDLSNLIDEYMEGIRKPDAMICHELKTIYRRDKDISELKKSYYAARKDLPHIIPIDAKRIAARPNAIVTKEKELWVRQDELLNLGNRNFEYLLFERLTPKGIDKSVIRIYRHDRNGSIKYESSLQRSCKNIFLGHHQLPPEFRTASYWSLPIYRCCISGLKIQTAALPLRVNKR